MAEHGAFVVVWQGEGNPGGAGFDIQGQLFAADGTRSGAEFRVNTYSTGAQRAPAVALDGMGRFLVVWKSDGQDGSGESVHGQRLDSAGLALGEEFQVNTLTTNDQTLPDVAATEAGHFLVVWASGHSGQFEIRGQFFDATDAVGEEFAINTDVGTVHFGPAVATAPGGEFYVTWHSVGFGFDIRRRGVTSNGLLDEEIQANVVEFGNQILSDVAVDPS